VAAEYKPADEKAVAQCDSHLRSASIAKNLRIHIDKNFHFLIDASKTRQIQMFLRKKCVVHHICGACIVIVAQATKTFSQCRCFTTKASTKTSR
jgi:hypothetical protein